MHAGIHSDIKTLVVDNHSLSQLRTCPRKYWYQIQQGLVVKPSDWSGVNTEGGELESVELSFGVAIHKALDKLFLGYSLDEAKQEFASAFKPNKEDARRNLGRGLELLESYQKTWFDVPQDYAGVLCEIPFAFELGVVELSSDRTGSSEVWQVIYTGIIDTILVRDNSTRYLMDHKTSGWNSSHLATAYETSAQFIGYAWALGQIDKPQDETEVVLDLMVLNPKTTALSRESFFYGQAAISEWKQDVLATCHTLLQFYSNNHFPKWGKDACVMYNRLCHFHELCRNYGDTRKMIQEGIFTQGKRWDTENRA